MTLPTITQILQHYPTPVAKALALGCAIPAIEMAICAVRDIGELYSNRNNIQLREDVSGELAGAIALGILALNPFAYSTAIGTAGFVLYSLGAGSEKNAYFSSMIIHQLANRVAEVLAPIVRGIADAVNAIWENFIGPAGIVLKDMVVSVLNLIPLPEHRVWYAAATVVTVSALAFTGYLPAFRLQSPIVIVG